MTMHNKEIENSSESYDSDSLSNFYKAYGPRALVPYIKDKTYYKTISDLKIQAVVSYLKELDERIEVLEGNSDEPRWD